MKIKTVTMIGMGAVGAVVGKGLREVLGRDNLECIASGERLSRYERDGIFINGERQDFKYVAPENAKIADLVIIATKNLQIEEALKDIKNAVGENTVILSLLNGIQSEREIISLYGEERTIYGFIVGLSSVHEGNNITCPDFGKIVFGEGDNSRTERIKSIEELFSAAKQNCLVPENIKLEMWKKYLLNVTCNTTSALCRAPYGAFHNETLKNIVRDAGKEVIAVANAEGIALTEKMCEDNLDLMCRLEPTGKTSMFQDVEAGRKTENKWFCGTVVELGKQYGIKTPICELLEKLVEVVEYSYDNK